MSEFLQIMTQRTGAQIFYEGLLLGKVQSFIAWLDRTYWTFVEACKKHSGCNTLNWRNIYIKKDSEKEVVDVKKII